MENNFHNITLLFIVFLLINPFYISDNSRALQNNYINVDEIDDEIIQLMKEEEIQSISACLIKDDNIIWSKGYGFYNKIPRKKPTLNTIYTIGSISKSFTATTMIQLVENKSYNVSLGDDINKFLPFEVRNPNHPDKPITIKMLLSHHSSLYWTSSSDQIKLAPYFYLRMNMRNIIFDNILLQFVFKQYLQPNGLLYDSHVWGSEKPGEEFYYSDFGFDLLTYIIEIITNIRYDEYCRKNIFEPLDMKNTSFNYKNLPKNQHSHPYIHIGNITVRPVNYYNIPYYGSGGIHTTAEDLSHFLIAHMNNGSYMDNQILNKTNTDTMHTVFYPRDDVNPNGTFDFQYALGFCIWNNTEETYIGHFGSWFGFDAIMKYRNSDKTGVIIFFDTFLGIYPRLNNTELNNEFKRQGQIHKMICSKLFEIADNL